VVWSSVAHCLTDRTPYGLGQHDRSSSHRPKRTRRSVWRCRLTGQMQPIDTDPSGARGVRTPDGPGSACDRRAARRRPRSRAAWHATQCHANQPGRPTAIEAPTQTTIPKCADTTTSDALTTVSGDRTTCSIAARTCLSGSFFRGSLVLCRSNPPKRPVRENVHQDEWGRRSAWLQRETELDCCCSCGGHSTNDGGRTDSQIPRCPHLSTEGFHLYTPC
jgi:hypothetical protein